MRIVTLALKDLLQILHDRRAAIFLVLMPLVFMSFFGLIYGGDSGSKTTRLQVGFINRDPAGAVSADLWNILAASDNVQPVKLEGKDADDVNTRVNDKKLAAAVIVPAAYSEQVLGGKEVRLTVIVDPQTGVGQTASEAIQAASNRLLGAVETARISTQTFEARQPFSDAGARQAYFNQALDLAREAWKTPAAALQVENGQLAKDQHELTPILQMAPGTMVQFTMFGLMTTAMVLVLERKSGTLKRLLTTSIRRWEVVTGHMLAMFVTVLFQEVVLVLAAQFLFGVDYLRQPLATVLVMLGLALWIACLGLLISAISRTEQQVVMWSLVAMFLFSSLGGVFFSLEYSGQVFSTIGHFTPAAWAMDGFQNIVLRGLGFSSVLLPVAMLVVYAAGFFGLSLWRLKFEQTT
jgi:ABC-2 type transport system permease protein